MNVSAKLFDGLKDAGFTGYFTDAWVDKTAYEVDDVTNDHTHFVVSPVDNIGDMVTVKLPKSKFVSAGYLIERFSSRKAKEFKNLAHLVKKIIDVSVDVYPASYGIGIAAIYNPLKATQVAHITTALECAGVVFTTEYSDARWVYRIKISKTAANLERLARMTG